MSGPQLRRPPCRKQIFLHVNYPSSHTVPSALTGLVLFDCSVANHAATPLDQMSPLTTIKAQWYVSTLARSFLYGEPVILWGNGPIHNARPRAVYVLATGIEINLVHLEFRKVFF